LTACPMLSASSSKEQSYYIYSEISRHENAGEKTSVFSRRKLNQALLAGTWHDYFTWTSQVQLWDPAATVIFPWPGCNAMNTNVWLPTPEPFGSAAVVMAWTYERVPRG